jgi:Na+/melibiose symporter-like transporter
MPRTAGPSITYFARMLGQPETRFGQVFAARGIGYLAGSVLSGHSDKCTGGVRFAVIGTASLVMGTCGIASLAAPNFWVLACITFVMVSKGATHT